MTSTSLPQGGGSLRSAEWLDVIDADYLRTFLVSGGAAVKVVVPGSAEVSAAVLTGLRERASAAGLAVAAVDASRRRVHMVDQLFAAVSAQLDWISVAQGWVRRAYRELAVQPGTDLSLDAVASKEQIDSGELVRGVRRSLERGLLGDRGLPEDLRTAVLRIAQNEAGFPGSQREDADAALAWLRGDSVPLSVLRRLGISGRVTRSSARPLLVALGAVVAGSGQPGLRGLAVSIDVDRLRTGKKPFMSDRSDIYYSKANVLDAWEVVRQLIDATEAMTNMLVVVVLPPELVTDPARGLPAYSALQLRVADEVRDRRRANPYAAMVRLDVRLEVVAGVSA